MKRGFRQSMAWLHTWVGLIAGWILFFIFVTGSLGYFYVEIDRWMRPESPLASTSLSVEEATARADAFLRHEAPDAAFWMIRLPTARESQLAVSWGDGSIYGRNSEQRIFDPELRRFVVPPEPRQTQGGYGLYRMHWKLHYLPQATGILIVGVCTLLMLVAILGGIVAHKRIFADFFTFRPSKGQRSWLDMHNLVSVAAMPFLLMITYSGLVFYMESYVPAGVELLFDDRKSYFGELEGEREVAKSGVAAGLLSLEHFRLAASASWGGGAADRIIVRHPFDAAGEVTLIHSGGATVLRNVTEKLHFGGPNGQLRMQESARESAPREVRSVLFGLHEGIFSGWTLRWLYFISGVLGSIMIATGLVLWTVKRRRREIARGGPGFGFGFVERLNIGTLAGLPVGVAAYFHANRLLPVDMPGRAAWEMHCLFLLWGAMLLLPTFRPPDKAWVEEFRIGAAAFLLLPLVNGLTTDRHLAVTLVAHDWGLAGFDLMALATGVVLLVLAHRVGRKQTAQRDEVRGEIAS